MQDESSGASQGAPPVIVDPHLPLLESDPHSLILGTLGRGCGRHTIILEHIGTPPREARHGDDR